MKIVIASKEIVLDPNICELVETFAFKWFEMHIEERIFVKTFEHSKSVSSNIFNDLMLIRYQTEASICLLLWWQQTQPSQLPKNEKIYTKARWYYTSCNFDDVHVMPIHTNSHHFCSHSLNEICHISCARIYEYSNLLDAGWILFGKLLEEQQQSLNRWLQMNVYVTSIMTLTIEKCTSRQRKNKMRAQGKCAHTHTQTHIPLCMCMDTHASKSKWLRLSLPHDRKCFRK